MSACCAPAWLRLADVDERYLRPAHFRQEVLAAARDLIGRTVVVEHEDDSRRCGLVVECEAYGGPDDPASHAAFRPGGRAALMFGDAGTIYVYAAYGMYPCLNIVTGVVGEPSAVLVRGVVIDGDQGTVLGPGRTSRALGISLQDHGVDVLGPRLRVTSARRRLTIRSTPRIGITRGVERPWRFIAVDFVHS